MLDEKEQKRDRERELRVESFTEQHFNAIFKEIVPNNPPTGIGSDVDSISQISEVIDEKVEVTHCFEQNKLIPLLSFNHPTIPAKIQEALKIMSITKPTPIQQYSIFFLKTQPSLSPSPDRTLFPSQKLAQAKPLLS
jgi:hypothetical protein